MPATWHHRNCQFRAIPLDQFADGRIEVDAPGTWPRAVRGDQAADRRWDLWRRRPAGVDAFVRCRTRPVAHDGQRGLRAARCRGIHRDPTRLGQPGCARRGGAARRECAARSGQGREGPGATHPAFRPRRAHVPARPADHRSTCRRRHRFHLRASRGSRFPDPGMGEGHASRGARTSRNGLPTMIPAVTSACAERSRPTCPVPKDSPATSSNC